MIELESMAIEMPEVKGHPNRAAFRGVLTMVDVASQRAPSGSNGHRVLLTRTAAEAALPSLLGMALDYSPTYDGHDIRRKVGVITKADIVGQNLEIGGYLYAKDFPDVAEEVAKTGRRPVAFTAKKEMAASIHAVAATSEGARLRASLAEAVERLRSLTKTRTNTAVTTTVPKMRAEAAGGSGAGLGMSFEVTNVEVVDKRSRVWKLVNVTFTGAAILRKDKAAYAETWIELS